MAAKIFLVETSANSANQETDGSDCKVVTDLDNADRANSML